MAIPSADVGNARQRIGKGPSRLNVVSLAIFLAVCAAAYSLWKFFPVYFTAWQVDSVLTDGAARCYQISKMADPARSEAERALVQTVRGNVLALGIDDPNLEVRLEYKGEQVTMRANYQAVVAHPYLSKPTILHLRRQGTSDIKRVKWAN